MGHEIPQFPDFENKSSQYINELIQDLVHAQRN